MAMTLTQLEQYMISEVENLHLKIDSAVEVLSKQIQDMMVYMTLRFDRLEAIINQHENRITNLENFSYKRKP